MSVELKQESFPDQKCVEVEFSFDFLWHSHLTHEILKNLAIYNCPGILQNWYKRNRSVKFQCILWSYRLEYVVRLWKIHSTLSICYSIQTTLDFQSFSVKDQSCVILDEILKHALSITGMMHVGFINSS